MAYKPNELKAARVRRGISQKELALMIGYTPANYCQKENANGNRTFNVRDMNAISEALNLSSAEREQIFFGV